MKQKAVCLTDYLPKVQESSQKEMEKAAKKGKPFSFGIKEETLACIEEMLKAGDVVTSFEKKGHIFFILG